MKVPIPKPANYPKKLKLLGDHIRKRRLELGLLQKEVAQIIGACEDTIRNWEDNQTDPALHFNPQIIQFLGYAPWEIRDTFGKRLVNARRALGMSQEELAQKVGVDPSTFGGWERGEKEASPEMREVLKMFLTREESK